MKTIISKVDQKIADEIDLIKENEGLGNRTSTIIFLVKYYKLTKNSSLDKSIELLNKILEKINISNLPSAKEQLADI